MGRKRTSLIFAAISIAALTAGFLIGPVLGAEDGGITGYYEGANTKLPNGGRPAKRVPFPEIKDWSSLRIRLERGPCFGACPTYTVEITGDGSVIYDGHNFVGVTGQRTDHIPTQKVRALFELFRRADFFWTLDHYRANVTDLPQFTVSIGFDGHQKTVTDYAGHWIGMPEAIGNLEIAIDDTANIQQWTRKRT